MILTQIRENHEANLKYSEFTDKIQNPDAHEKITTKKSLKIIEN